MSARAADAKETYGKACAKCHGEDGKGQTKMGQKLGLKDLSDAKVQADLTDTANRRSRYYSSPLPCTFVFVIKEP